jgi:intein/homing endonuclease
VIADDPTTPGGIEAKQVLETFVRKTDALVDLYVDGEVISTTGEHPFWVPDLGWVEAKDLIVGSLLQTEDGRIIDVDGVEKREGQFEVYNFRVEGIPTYFVSDLGILVHNACHKHHSDPKFMGGDPKQPLTTLDENIHRQLHNDMNTFLETKTDSSGHTMRPKPGNPGIDIQTNFSRDELLRALAEFYRGPGAKYTDAANDFFKQHPGL